MNLFQKAGQKIASVYEASPLKKGFDQAAVLGRRWMLAGLMMGSSLGAAAQQTTPKTDTVKHVHYTNTKTTHIEKDLGTKTTLLRGLTAQTGQKTTAAVVKKHTNLTKEQLAVIKQHRAERHAKWLAEQAAKPKAQIIAETNLKKERARVALLVQQNALLMAKKPDTLLVEKTKLVKDITTNTTADTLQTAQTTPAAAIIDTPAKKIDTAVITPVPQKTAEVAPIITAPKKHNPFILTAMAGMSTVLDKDNQKGRMNPEFGVRLESPKIANIFRFVVSGADQERKASYGVSDAHNIPVVFSRDGNPSYDIRGGLEAEASKKLGNHFLIRGDLEGGLGFKPREKIYDNDLTKTGFTEADINAESTRYKYLSTRFEIMYGPGRNQDKGIKFVAGADATLRDMQSSYGGMQDSGHKMAGWHIGIVAKFGK